jgi:hypothetical protein
MLRPSLRSRYLFRRTDATAPSLGLAQSFWALGQREISLAQSLESACADGFEYFEVGLREDRLAETASLLKAFPLKLIAQGWATAVGEARVFLERAVELGAVAINVHLGHAYLTADEAALMVDDVYRMADSYQLPLLLETHRGRVTQDLCRTAELLRLRPDTVVTLDLSHYLVAGENRGVRLRQAFASFCRVGLIGGSRSRMGSPFGTAEGSSCLAACLNCRGRRRALAGRCSAGAVFVLSRSRGLHLSFRRLWWREGYLSGRRDARHY